MSGFSMQPVREGQAAPVKTMVSSVSSNAPATNAWECLESANVYVGIVLRWGNFKIIEVEKFPFSLFQVCL